MKTSGQSPCYLSFHKFPYIFHLVLDFHYTTHLPILTQRSTYKHFFLIYHPSPSFCHDIQEPSRLFHVQSPQVPNEPYRFLDG